MTRFLRAVRLAATFLALAGSAAVVSAAETDRPATVNPAFLVDAPAVPPLLNVPPVAAVPRGPTPLLSSQRTGYASLEDAVAAHYGTSPDDEAARCLAGAVFFESKGEPLSGQLAVAQVVVNRARSGRFASDVCGVVRQPGQFSFVRGGRIPDVDEGRPAWRTALAVARVALAEAWEGVGPRALYFHARAVGVRAGMIRIAAIGNHVFFR